MTASKAEPIEALRKLPINEDIIIGLDVGIASIGCASMKKSKQQQHPKFLYA